jgi:hypothetical protein
MRNDCSSSVDLSNVSEQVKINELFNDFEYISVETNDASIFGEIDKLIVCDECESTRRTASQQFARRAGNAQTANQKQLFFEAVPFEFFCDRSCLTIAKRLQIPDKTAEKRIAKVTQSGLINYFAHDKYRKT